MHKALWVGAAALFLAGPALAATEGETLMKTKGCVACHAVDKKLVGPAYKDVAAKYAGDKTAAAKLADKIVKGGVGVWGQIPMPANNLTPDEAKALAAWVLSTK